MGEREVFARRLVDNALAILRLQAERKEIHAEYRRIDPEGDHGS